MKQHRAWNQALALQMVADIVSHLCVSCFHSNALLAPGSRTPTHPPKAPATVICPEACKRPKKKIASNGARQEPSDANGQGQPQPQYGRQGHLGLPATQPPAGWVRRPCADPVALASPASGDLSCRVRLKSAQPAREQVFTDFLRGFLGVEPKKC